MVQIISYHNAEILDSVYCSSTFNIYKPGLYPVLSSGWTSTKPVLCITVNNLGARITCICMQVIPRLVTDMFAVHMVGVFIYCICV